VDIVISRPARRVSHYRDQGHASSPPARTGPCSIDIAVPDTDRSQQIDNLFVYDIDDLLQVACNNARGA
jgi:glutamyl-tRNA reductase